MENQTDRSLSPLDLLTSFANQSRGDDSQKFFIKTFGCQMNVRDSEVICGLLSANGYRLTAKPEEAEVIIFNTCSVRQHAEDKVWSEIGRIAKLSPHDLARKTRQIKTGGTTSPAARKKIIGLVGCMAQNYKDEIFRRMPAVDFVVGPGDIDKIPEIIATLTPALSLEGEGVLEYERKIWETEGKIRPEEIYHTGFYEDKEHAYVVISEGCSNFCSYCVVPYTRGPLRHRNHKDILKEIKEAVGRGIISVTLLGQNVNAYNDGNASFIKLIGMIEGISGLEEFSFITSHPKDTPPDLFKVMAGSSKLKKYLHLPVQSGSDRILKLMNRGYSRKSYLELVEEYRKIVKGATLTTDIIVGFPGESEDDFQETFSLAKDTQFNGAYIFKYSVRPHTAAAGFPDDLPWQEKEKRHMVILELQKKISNQVKSQKEKGKTTRQKSKL